MFETFMFLLMKESKKNREVAVNLASLSDHKIINIEGTHLLSADENDHQLVLIDIEEDSKYIQSLEPTEVAELLLKKGLTSQINSIVFIVSDMHNRRNLREFSRAIIKELQHTLKHKMTAYVPTDFNHQHTLLVPPKKGQDNWQVFGIDETAQKNKFNLNLFSSKRDKTRLWKGPDILDWLSKEKKAVEAYPENIGEITFSL